MSDKIKSRAHGKKTDKQLESFINSTNPKDMKYTFALMEKQRRIDAGTWTRK